MIWTTLATKLKDMHEARGRRRDRRFALDELISLSDHRLRDLGLSREDLFRR
jgi:uncharacterized protein YjiS (DUF1127 family)